MASSLWTSKAAGHLEEPRLERCLNLLELVNGNAPFNQQAVDFGVDLTRCTRRQCDLESRRAHLDPGSELGFCEEGHSSTGLRAVHLKLEQRASQQFGDWPLPNDVAPIHDRYRVTCPLDFVKQMRRQHDCSVLRYQ